MSSSRFQALTAICRSIAPHPPTNSRFPGVVVIHDAGGMSNDLRRQANWLASEGFLAAAPNLYHWGTMLTCIRQIMHDVRARRGRSFDEIDAVRTWLAHQPSCTGKVGVIGFCMAAGSRCCSRRGMATLRPA